MTKYRSVTHLVAEESGGCHPRQHLLVRVARRVVSGDGQVIAVDNRGGVEGRRVEPSVCVKNLNIKTQFPDDLSTDVKHDQDLFNAFLPYSKHFTMVPLIYPFTPLWGQSHARCLNDQEQLRVQCHAQWLGAGRSWRSKRQPHGWWVTTLPPDLQLHMACVCVFTWAMDQIELSQTSDTPKQKQSVQPSGFSSWRL